MMTGRQRKSARLGALAIIALPAVITGQTAKVATDTGPAKADMAYTGCVTPNAHAPDVLVLLRDDACMVLAGKLNAAQVKGHTVTFTGMLLEPAGTEPLTLKVTKTQRVGEACSQSCMPEPPGSRGLHGNLKHGREGATKGAHDPTPPPE